tara:strand:+ start:255 stop:1196 length:942 start_codon:yes stop_codon:yes gene_type:complete
MSASDRKYSQRSFASAYAHGDCGAFALAAKKYIKATPYVMYIADLESADDEGPAHAFFKYKGKFYDAYGLSKSELSMGKLQYQYAEKADITTEADKNGKLIKKQWPWNTDAAAIEKAWDDFLLNADPKLFKGIKADLGRSGKSFVSEDGAPTTNTTGVADAPAPIGKKKPGEAILRRLINAKKAEAKFEPHWMYDPETGEKERAETKADHERLKAKGWSHTKPVTEEYLLERGGVFDKMFPGISDIVSKIKNPHGYKAAVLTYKELVDGNAAPTNGANAAKASRMYNNVDAGTLGKIITALIKKKKLAPSYAF